MTTRSSRRAHEREAAIGDGAEEEGRAARARRLAMLPRLVAFLAIAALVLGGGMYLAGSVFVGQRGTSAVAGAIPMRISMAGYDPAVLHAKPGETLTIDWWNTDGAMHLQRGVHTLVSDALGVRYELPAESRKTITITAPATPGDYDFWCDSCCGGKDSPDMHGTLRVSA